MGSSISETWGAGGRNPNFLPRATTFLVMTAFNSVLPELVVLISTTNSGGTALNAADRILMRSALERWSLEVVKSGFRPPDPHVSYQGSIHWGVSSIPTHESQRDWHRFIMTQESPQVFPKFFFYFSKQHPGHSQGAPQARNPPLT